MRYSTASGCISGEVNWLEEIDIWRTANLLMGEHGQNAGTIAARRAEELLMQRDTEGWSTWLKIWRAIKVFQTDKPSDGETLH